MIKTRELKQGGKKMAGSERMRSDGFIFKILEAILYIAFILLGFYLAFLIKFDMEPSPTNIQPFFDSALYIGLASVVIFYFYDIVSTLKKSLFENAVIIAISLGLIDITTVAIVFFNRGFAFPRSIFLIGFIIQFILIFFTKVIILKVIKLSRAKKDIVIIAEREEGEYIAKKILLDKHNLDNVRYICDEINKTTYDLIDMVDKVYIGNSIGNKDKLRLVNYCSEKGKNIYLIPGLFEISLVDFKISQVNDLLVFKLEDLELTQEQKFIKRTLDIIISAIGLTIALPILLIISIVIKIYDRGPVLFKQERVTRANKRFKLYKFRTMIVDAEKHTGPVLASEKDPRITPLGNFLRASRIDEIPQLFNVLKGDMSLVGPRPERPFFVEQFNEEFDEFKYRVFVKAGITGLAQILGTYATDPSTKAKYDLLYIKNYSLMLDIKIIFNTIKIIFMKDSSKGTGKDKELGDIFDELGLSVYDEIGVTKID